MHNDISPPFYPTARNIAWADSLPVVNDQNSYHGADGARIGSIAELALMVDLAKNGIDFNWHGYQGGPFDILAGSTKIDVKAKVKTYTYAERPERRGRDVVDAFTRQQDYDCDVYVFYCAVVREKGAGVECVEPVGWMPKLKYWRECDRFSEGDTVGNFTYKFDSGTMPQSMLYPMQKLFDALVAGQIIQNLPTTIRLGE